MIATARTGAAALFRTVDASDSSTDDHAIDDALGLRRSEIEAGLSLGQLLVRLGHHRVETADLPYHVIRDVYRALDLPAGVAVLDLGSGYGRIAFYGALLWNRRVYGIEIVPERVREAQRVKEEFGFDTVHFTAGDVLAVPWPEVTVYLALNSVLPDLMPRLIGRLRHEAAARPIRIASICTANEYFRRETWLDERVPLVPSARAPVSLRVFESSLCEAQVAV